MIIETCKVGLIIFFYTLIIGLFILALSFEVIAISLAFDSVLLTIGYIVAVITSLYGMFNIIFLIVMK